MALQILQDFLARTTAANKRYLWTDAFAVAGLVALGRAAEAKSLVDQVHETLGKDSEGKWLSGDPKHPTRNGLRIGKPMEERPPSEIYQGELEWERDGQYFHYLTKWAWALHTLGDHEASAQARELMSGATPHFFHSGGSGMYWKMSVHLDRPQVPSQGHHDPLDGYIAGGLVGLDKESAMMRRLRSMMGEASSWATSDSLGIGGLLMAAALARSVPWMATLGDSVMQVGLQCASTFARSPVLDLPSSHRIAFRELGLSIGLNMVPQVERTSEVEALRNRINEFWSAASNRAATGYQEHLDINEVMRAFALIPPTTGLLPAVATPPAQSSKPE